MCGICGFIGKTKKDWKREEVLEGMKDALRHRGPDDGGSYLCTDAALGFRRLSIIDLETGRQPMENETGDKIVVFNGEIYNYRKLREELIQAGHIFRTQSDTEVLLHGYEEWGEAMLGHLRGMFAFVIWDTVKKEIFAARDFFGIKPFYYALVGNVLVFASEIKSILRYPGYQKEVNEEALEQFLSFQYSVLEESFFKGIYRLEPGHFLRYRAGSIVLELQKYFEPVLEPWEGKEEESWLDEIDVAVAQSIQAHMESDVEIGTYLSGGVDSGLVAREFTGKRAYTVGFGQEGSAYNEIGWARQTANQCSLRHQGYRIREQEFWEAVPQVLYYMDEPLGDAASVGLYFLAREASRDVKVVVSGEGSDELFGGYRIYCEPGALRRYQMLPKRLRRQMAKLVKYFPNWKGKNFLIRGSKSVEERFIGNANIFSYEERRALLKNPTGAWSPEKLLAGDYGETKGLADADRMQEIDLRHWLPGDILMKADRMSMAHSLEVRVPFLDRDVFELARHLPSGMKVRNRTTKYALRKVACRWLDSSTSERPKVGFPVPIRHWMREGEGYHRVKKAFEGEAAKKYFHEEQLMRLLEEHKNKQKDNSRKLWVLYTFCLWYEINFPGSPDPEGRP